MAASTLSGVDYTGALYVYEGTKVYKFFAFALYTVPLTRNVALAHK